MTQDAANQLTNGRTAIRVFDHLQYAKARSVKEIAAAIGISPGAVWNALNRLRGAGVARVVRMEATKATSWSPTAIWGLVEDDADPKADERKRDIEPKPQQSLPVIGMTIVQRALASQPPLATVWNGAHG